MEKSYKIHLKASAMRTEQKTWIKCVLEYTILEQKNSVSIQEASLIWFFHMILKNTLLICHSKWLFWWALRLLQNRWRKNTHQCKLVSLNFFLDWKWLQAVFSFGNWEVQVRHKFSWTDVSELIWVNGSALLSKNPAWVNKILN